MTNKLKELLPDVNLSEDFEEKFGALLEVAVNSRVEKEIENIKKAADEYANYVVSESEKKYAELNNQITDITEKAQAYADYVVEEMTNRVESYCEYVVESFVKDHTSKLIDTENYLSMAKAFAEIKETFERNYFGLNSEPASVALQEKLDNVTNEFNQLFETHRKLKEDIAAYNEYVENENRKSIFEDKTKNLALTQKNKLEKIMSTYNNDNLRLYEETLNLLIAEMQNNKENITESSKPNEENVTENKPKKSEVGYGLFTALSEGVDEVDRMSHYLKSFKGLKSS